MTKPITLLHGWGYRPAVWDALVPHLNMEARAPALAPPSDDIAEWADSIASDLAPDSTLVGWSLGAMLAMQIAAHHPERVGHLVLIGATPRFVATDAWPHGLDAATVAAFSEGFARQPARTLQRFVALQVMDDAARSAITPVLQNALADPQADAEALSRGLRVLAQSDLRAMLPTRTTPTLLIHGRHDALMPVTAAQWLAERLAARLEIVDNAGHAPLVSNPSGVAALIRSFMC
ncbi:alpha/beta fold hydrolase [Uliginosibacterium sp. sgz301328]|uniref:alpha/beta fold hydrolase n=1 Tax=Uliginosibacterium sp. sgz301328 TaxID=3243764 RepID=UPI00359E733E